MFKNIQSKIMGMVIGTVIVLVASLSAAGMYSNYLSTVDTLSSTLPLMTKLTTGKVEVRLNDYIGVLQQLAQKEAGLSGTPVERVQRLREICQEVGLVGMGITDAQGNYSDTENDVGTMEGQEFFQKVRETKAVNTMQLGYAEVVSGSQEISKVKAVFDTIKAGVDRVEAQMGQIATATREVAVGSREISGAVSNVDQISQNNAVMAETLSATVEEQSAAMDQIAHSAEELAQSADTLKAQLHKFRL